MAKPTGEGLIGSISFGGNFADANFDANSTYAEMARRPLEAEQCALVVVDMQERLLPPIWEKQRLVRNVQLLIRLAGILKIPAIVTTQNAKGLGHTVPEIASLLPESPSIDKLMFSCFGSDVFCSLLKRLPGQRTTVLLCGMETHICVMQTALGLIEAGRRVWLVRDAVGSRRAESKETAIRRLERSGAEIVTTEMVIFEWVETAEHPRFRDALALVR